MNWKKRYEFRKLTDPSKVKPGMKAKLIVGSEKSWGPNSWIIGKKNQVFEVYSYNNEQSKNIGVKVPIESMPSNFWDENSDGGEEEAIDKERGFSDCWGEFNWFEFSN